MKVLKCLLISYLTLIPFVEDPLLSQEEDPDFPVADEVLQDKIVINLNSLVAERLRNIQEVFDGVQASLRKFNSIVEQVENSDSGSEGSEIMASVSAAVLLGVFADAGIGVYRHGFAQVPYLRINAAWGVRMFEAFFVEGRVPVYSEIFNDPRSFGIWLEKYSRHFEYDVSGKRYRATDPRYAHLLLGSSKMGELEQTTIREENPVGLYIGTYQIGSFPPRAQLVEGFIPGLIDAR
jgi:hypothetical protein